MSPILVRPVREQLEHDRVIRLLQAKYKKKFDVAINPGNQQSAPVPIGPSSWYPDLVLQSTERSHKLLGVVEVETVESINHLEAMSQWAAFARLKAPFHLYVPAAMVDVARRFCLDLNISVTEIWAYHAIGDQIRFTAVQRAPGSGDGPSAPVRESRRPRVAAGPSKSARPRVTKTAVSKPVTSKPVTSKPATSKPAVSKPRASKLAAAKPVRRPSAPPARKKVATSTSTTARATTRPAAKRPATRASRRK